MATYGEIRMRLVKELPGVDRDLLDSWILDRYIEILDLLPWRRQSLSSNLTTRAAYETGTVALTAGSAAVTGTGTVWTAGMTGLDFAASGNGGVYRFTHVSPTTGTLDRAWEGETETEATYALQQRVYEMPANCRVPAALDTWDRGPLARRSAAELRARPRTSGTPLEWAPAADSATNRMQIELWPVPVVAETFRLTFDAEAPGWSAAAPAVALLPWLRESCLVSGVQATGYRHLALRDDERANVYLRLADAAEGRFQKLLGDMHRTACHALPPRRLAIRSVRGL
jgi:hypothetical protein